MVVTFLNSRPDSAGINLHFNRRSARVLRIKLQSAVNILEVSTDVGHHHVPSAKLRRRVPRLKSPFGHLSLSFETSSTLDKYPREVLPLTVENNQPQDCYHRRRYCSARIQEHVITNDVNDYWSQQHQRERHEPVRKQQQTACDLQNSNHPIIVRQEQRADELPGQSRRHRPHAEKIQKAIQAKHDKD